MWAEYICQGNTFRRNQELTLQITRVIPSRVVFDDPDGPICRYTQDQCCFLLAFIVPTVIRHRFSHYRAQTRTRRLTKADKWPGGM